MRGERVPIGDEKKTFVFFLKLDPVRKRAEEMAEMEAASGAHAAEDSFELSQPGELLPHVNGRWRARGATNRARLRCVAFRWCLRKLSARARRGNSARRRSRANSLRCRALAPRGMRRDWPFRWHIILRAKHTNGVNQTRAILYHA